LELIGERDSLRWRIDFARLDVESLAEVLHALAGHLLRPLDERATRHRPRSARARHAEHVGTRRRRRRGDRRLLREPIRILLRERTWLRVRFLGELRESIELVVRRRRGVPVVADRLAHARGDRRRALRRELRESIEFVFGRLRLRAHCIAPYFFAIAAIRALYAAFAFAFRSSGSVEFITVCSLRAASAYSCSAARDCSAVIFGRVGAD